MHLKRHSWALSGEILSFCCGLGVFGPICFRTRQTGGLTDRLMSLMQPVITRATASQVFRAAIYPKITSCCLWATSGKQTSSHGRYPKARFPRCDQTQSNVFSRASNVGEAVGGGEARHNRRPIPNPRRPVDKCRARVTESAPPGWHFLGRCHSTRPQAVDASH